MLPARPQERNRLSVASEAATRVKLKRQDLEAKQEELQDLLRAHRTRLASVLGTRAGGVIPPPFVHE